LHVEGWKIEKRLNGSGFDREGDGGGGGDSFVHQYHNKNTSVIFKHDYTKVNREND